MANDDIQEKRLRARLALEGETRHAKREQSEAELAKMRQEAMLAMEGSERKAAREAKLKAEQDQIAKEQKRLAEIERVRQLETERKANEEEKARLEKQKQEKVKETQVEKIHQAEAKIENLKQSPTATISSVRTLQSDLAQAVERRKMSATSIAVKNQDAPKISLDEEPKSSPLKTILTVILIIILIGAGGGAIWYVQKINLAQTVPVNNLNIPKLITAENTEVINIATTTPAAQTKADLKNKLANTASGITNFYFTTQIASPEEPEELSTVFINPTLFAKLTAVSVPDGVLRSVGDIFTLGVIASGATKAPFIILQIKADSTDRALARMFDWEETMPNDLADLWSTTATTSNTSFTDKRINNLDTRILYNDNREPILLHTFFNNKYIIITTTDTVISDLVARLAP